VLDRLNGVYVPMGRSNELKTLKAGIEFILSPEWKKSDIYLKKFKISTKIEKVLIFTS
jgi:hypothetical protein